jgi:hypothetical protein
MDALLKDYPIIKLHQEIIDTIISQNRKYFTTILAKELNVKLDDQNAAEFCQIFFYVCIDLDKLLPDINQIFAELVMKHMSKQVDLSRKTIISIAQENIERGITTDEILEYLLLIFEISYRKEFPYTKLLDFKTK